MTAHLTRAIRYLRAVQGVDGGWQCRVGRTCLDEHTILEDSLSHLAAVADGMDDSSDVRIVVHASDKRPVFRTPAERFA